ncbi:MAG: flavodoxin family protein [Candidatus Lokiarchaeota archaeon]|nr:flavodoxin family protein [Candidatus Lokiarchaeota archaeon]
MKVLALNSSPRPNGNTSQLIEIVFNAIKEDLQTVETESIQLNDKIINSCKGCFICSKQKDGKCIQNDDLNPIIEKMRNADCILFGSPVYWGAITGKMKCLLERTGMVAMFNKHFLKRKIGAPIIAVRRQGALPSFSTITYFIHGMQMLMTGASYWNLGIGLAPGDVQKDSEGMENMKNLGKNIAWLLEKIK